MNTFICFAHRGASGHAPENTLASIRKALDLGACWVEVDVYRAENELVVIHDRRLERTTNGKGDVSRQSLSYLRSLDAGCGEKIPFLSEVLDTVAGKAGVNIELKGVDTPGPTAALIDAYVKNRRFGYDQLIVSSFQQYLLSEIRRLNSEIRIGVLLEKRRENDIRFAEEIGAYSLHVHKRIINNQLVAEAHRGGMKIFVYTVDRMEDIHKLQQIGADGVFTNYPERCL